MTLFSIAAYAQETTTNTQKSIHVVYPGPGCFAQNTLMMGLSSVIPDAVASSYNGTNIDDTTVASSDSALSADSLLLLPDPSNSTAAHVGNLLSVAQFLQNAQPPQKIQAQKIADVDLFVRKGEVLFTLPHFLVDQEAFQAKKYLENRPHIDWMQKLRAEVKKRGKYADLEARRAVIWQLSISAAKNHDSSILVVDFSDNAAAQESIKLPSLDAHFYHREYVLANVIKNNDDKVLLINVGQQLGRPELVEPLFTETIARLKTSATDTNIPSSHTLVVPVHAGGLRDLDENNAEKIGKFSICAPFFLQHNVAAMGLGTGELALGPKNLVASMDQYPLPWTAANIKPADSNLQDSFRRAVPRFRIVEQNGLVVALVGIVGPSRLRDLPAEQQKEWLLLDPTLTLDETAEAVYATLGRWPDLLVALVAGTRLEIDRLAGVDHVDAVIGDFSRIDAVKQKQTIDFTHTNSVRSREYTALPEPTMIPRDSTFGVGTISALYDVIAASSTTNPIDPQWDQYGPQRLQRLQHENQPVFADDPVDRNLQRPLRVLEETQMIQNAQILLPDLTDVIEKNPNFHLLVWGDRILIGGRYWLRRRSTGIRISDPLFMRLVANIMREKTNSEVVFLRNFRRNMAIGAGPYSKQNLAGWFPSDDKIEIFMLTGAELQSFGNLLLDQERSQNQTDAIDPKDFVFASGFHAQQNVVLGRPVVATELYRVAISSTVRSVPAAAKLLAGKPSQFLSVLDDETKQAKTVRSRDLFFDKLSNFLETPVTSPPTSSPASSPTSSPASLPVSSPAPVGHLGTVRVFDQKYLPELAKLFEDQSLILQTRWLFSIDDISVNALGYRNSDNISIFADSRETRASQPNAYSVGGKLNMGIRLDTPSLSWETRLKTQFDSLALDKNGGTFDVTEPSDDVVLSSELRITSVSVGNNSGLSITPFMQLAVDSELTAATKPDPNNPDVDVQLPYQLLGLESVGAVARFGDWFPEVRLGVVIQQDVSGALPPNPFDLVRIRNDFGVVAGVSARIPVYEKLTLSSDTNLRYLFPSALGVNDPTALSLRLQSVNKLNIPITSSLSMFLGADLFALNGQQVEKAAIAWSASLTAGIKFAGNWKF